MTRVFRPILPLVLALLALGAAAPPVAAASHAFPIQSAGDRGEDVMAIQWLLAAHGHPVAADGIFATSTTTAVNAFKSTVGLTPNGIVGEGTWKALIVRGLKRGDTGPAVKAVQRELRAKRHIDVPVDGTFGASTSSGVKLFQAHAGIHASGVMDGATWRALISHFELPTFNKTSLCDYSVGNGPANWGTSATINAIEAAARIIAGKGYGRVAVGDVSLQHGGNIPLHQTHERGMDADIRPMRKANDQCRWGTSYHWSTYDRKATRALINAIRAVAKGHVKLIYFNDPVLIREGLTVHFPGHDDHLHVRFCEPSYALRMFDC